VRLRVSAHGIRIISQRGIDRVVKDILAQGGRL
jgi:large subunit ribosomal protein L28